VVASLQARHSDMVAARSVYELPVGKLNFAADWSSCTLKVGEILSIQMVPNYPALGHGEPYDWSTVGRIKLMGINGVS